MQPNAEHHRVSVGEIALALAQRRTEPNSSVTLTRNAKGDVQVGVEVVGPDVDACAAEAVRQYDWLVKLYPLSKAQREAQ